MKGFEWVDATSVAAALEKLGGKAVVKAGGIDLLDLMKEHVASPSRLVNIRNIPELDRIEGDSSRGMRLGPNVTLARLATAPAVRSGYYALAKAVGLAATPQIRNVATLAGNLLQRPRCWYFRSEAYHCRRKGGAHCFALDGENACHAVFGNTTCAIVHPSAAAVPLVAFGARVEVTSARGSREVPIADLFVTPEVDVRREHCLAPDELVTAILLPPLPSSTVSEYVKHADKESFDWPLAEAAVVLDLDSGKCRRASIVLGAAAPIPWRAKAAETALAGRTIDDATSRAAAKVALEGATPLARNRAKLELLETATRRAIQLAVYSKESRR